MKQSPETQGRREETRILRGGQLWLKHRTPRPLELRVCADGACWYSPRGLQSCPAAPQIWDRCAYVPRRAFLESSPAPAPPPGTACPAHQARSAAPVHVDLGIPTLPPRDALTSLFPGGALVTPPGCSYFLRRWGYGNKSPFCDTRNASRQCGDHTPIFPGGRAQPRPPSPDGKRPGLNTHPTPIHFLLPPWTDHTNRPSADLSPSIIQFPLSS